MAPTAALKGGKAKVSTTAPTKRPQLTLSQLAAYDDILTDALVDHVSCISAQITYSPERLADRKSQTFYWTTIPKNRPSYHPSRGVREAEITKIIQSHVVVAPDLELAEMKLLATDGLRKFHDALRTAQEQDDFRRHLPARLPVRG
jgi:histone-lysine N-methyltransferase SUV420H